MHRNEAEMETNEEPEWDSRLPERLFATDCYPDERLNIYSRVDLLTVVAKSLKGTREFEVIRNSPLGKMFDLPVRRCPVSLKLLHGLLSRQVVTKKRYELWCVFGGQPTRFSIVEFQKMTGLNCSEFPDDYNIEEEQKGQDECGEYWRKLFGDNKKVTLPELKEELEKSVDMSGWRKLRIALILIVDGILIAKHQGGKPTPRYVEMLSNVSLFLQFPWGRESFFTTIRSMLPLRRIVGSSKDPVEVLKAGLQQQTFRVIGFPLALQLWALKAIPLFVEKIVDGHDRRSFLEFEYKTKHLFTLLSMKDVWTVENDEELAVKPYAEVDDGSSEWTEWEDEVKDKKVNYMLELIKSGHQFNKFEWPGGDSGIPKYVFGKKNSRKSRKREAPPLTKLVSAKKMKFGGNDNDLDSEEMFSENQKKWLREEMKRLLKKMSKQRSTKKKRKFVGKFGSNQLLHKIKRKTSSKRRILEESSEFHNADQKESGDENGQSGHDEEVTGKTVSEEDSTNRAEKELENTNEPTKGIDNASTILYSVISALNNVVEASVNEEEFHKEAEQSLTLGNKSSEKEQNGNTNEKTQDSNDEVVDAPNKCVDSNIIESISNEGTQDKCEKSSADSEEENDITEAEVEGEETEEDNFEPLPKVDGELFAQFKKSLRKAPKRVYKSGFQIPVTNKMILELADPDIFISNEHMMLLVKLVKELHEKHFAAEKSLIVGPWFSSKLETRYRHFKCAKDRRNISYGTDIVNEVTKEGYAWTSDIDTVYMPMLWKPNHWIGLAINFKLWNIEILDPASDNVSNKEVEKNIAPIVQMLPHIIERFCEPQLSQSNGLNPFCYKRIEDAYKCKRYVDTGVVAVKFIEMHALGLNTYAAIDDGNVEHMRKKYAMELHSVVTKKSNSLKLKTWKLWILCFISYGCLLD